MRATALSLLVATAAVACSQEVPTLVDCEPAGGVTPVCGFRNPEDLAQVPGSSWLIVSQAPRAGQSGSLVAFRSLDGRIRSLWPDGPDEGRLSSTEPTPGWGTPDCPGPPDPAVFHPHGIDIRGASMEAPRLAVVNHGGREAVEIFEVGYAGGPALGWRGCVPMPENAFMNDVAFHPDGGFVVAKMMAAPDGAAGLWAGIQMLLGMQTGAVLRWKTDGTIAEVEKSGGVGPNGVAVSAEGSEIYFSEWAGNRLVRLRLGDEIDRDQVDVPHRPDNLSWSRDGRLLVAGQVGRVGDVLGCGRLESGTCALDYSVLAVDPSTLDVEVLLERDAEATGAVSAALHVGGELFLGSFSSDRIARTRFPH